MRESHVALSADARARNRAARTRDRLQHALVSLLVINAVYMYHAIDMRLLVLLIRVSQVVRLLFPPLPFSLPPRRRPSSRSAGDQHRESSRANDTGDADNDAAFDAEAQMILQMQQRSTGFLLFMTNVPVLLIHAAIFSEGGSAPTDRLLINFLSDENFRNVKMFYVDAVTILLQVILAGLAVGDTRIISCIDAVPQPAATAIVPVPLSSAETTGASAARPTSQRIDADLRTHIPLLNTDVDETEEGHDNDLVELDRVPRIMVDQPHHQPSMSVSPTPLPLAAV
jgi:hypothetical protein